MRRQGSSSKFKAPRRTILNAVLAGGQQQQMSPLTLSALPTNSQHQHKRSPAHPPVGEEEGPLLPPSSLPASFPTAKKRRSEEGATTSRKLEMNVGEEEEQVEGKRKRRRGIDVEGGGNGAAAAAMEEPSAAECEAELREDQQQLADFAFTQRGPAPVPPDKDGGGDGSGSNATARERHSLSPASGSLFLTTTPPLARPQSFYGLPYSAEVLFRQRGVSKLYPWQDDVLSRTDVCAGTNFVYSLPTSGGKTLVAEVLLLRSIVLRKKSAMFVLPFVSVAEEKCAALQVFAEALGFQAEGYFGVNGRFPVTKSVAVFVCTIEKANSMLNHLAEEGRAAEIGCVVVDELHMVGESHRGTVLELFLSKMLCLVPEAQIVGMSATVPNLPQIAQWLRAACYEGDFRPVPLKQYSVCDGIVLDDGDVCVRSLGGSSEHERLVELVREVSPAGSVLVFCASRAQTVDVARQISRSLAAAGLKQFGCRALLQELATIGRAGDSFLPETMPCGVAYHHGGMLMEEREFIERAYRAKHITVLCCTSTLAAGVNLPARRVIFRSPYIGRDFLTKSRYLQMCGRAGRAGLDPFGESFMMLVARDRARGHELMRAPTEPTLSTVFQEPQGFTKCLLECIGVGVCASFQSTLNWASSLLPNYTKQPIQSSTTSSSICQRKEEGEETKECNSNSSANLVEAWSSVLNDSLNVLARQKLITVRPNPNSSPPPPPQQLDPATNGNSSGSGVPPVDFIVEMSPFGSSAVRSCFSIEEATMVRDELELLQRTGLILADDLHVCYFLTPVRDVGDCDWNAYRSILSRLSEPRQRIAELLGVDEYFVDQKAMGLGTAAPTNETAKRQLFTTKRFYVALQLSDLLAETPIGVVEERYRVNRGQLQTLLKNAAMFSSSITMFCNAMGWYSLEAVLSSFVKRLGYGVKPDVLPLMEIRGVQPARARALWNAGYRDPKTIAAATPDEMVKKVKSMNSQDNKSAKFFSVKSAVAVIKEANRLLQHKVREKKGEILELTAPAANRNGVAASQQLQQPDGMVLTPRPPPPPPPFQPPPQRSKTTLLQF